MMATSLMEMDAPPFVLFRPSTDVKMEVPRLLLHVSTSEFPSKLPYHPSKELKTKTKEFLSSSSILPSSTSTEWISINRLTFHAMPLTLSQK